MEKSRSMGKASQFIIFALKVILIHTVTYTIAGMISSSVNNYRDLFQEPVIENFMRPFDSTIVMFGPVLQPIRALLYAICLFPLMDFFHSKKNGWLYMWSLFAFIGIFGTSGAAPGSLEGLIFTQLPLSFHLIGLPEILLQTLALSILVFLWDKNRLKRINDHHSDES